MESAHDLLGARTHRRHRSAAVARRSKGICVRTRRTRDLLAAHVGLEADGLVDSRVDHRHLDAEREQAFAQKRVLATLGVERAEKDDRAQLDVPASGSTPR
jgi:hypothetical protein